MKEEKRRKGLLIVIVTVLIAVFIGAFQLYISIDKKSYRYVQDLLSDSFSVLEVSMDDEEQTYYVNDKEIILEQLIEGLDATTFKPTRQTPKNPQYTIRIYNESLQVETTLTVFSSNQMKINDSFYNVDEVDFKMFEQALFKEEYKVSLSNMHELMLDKISVAGLFPEENKDWAEVIALARIAKENDIDLSNLDFLSFAPTKEVAEQIIAYGINGSSSYTSLIQAVQQERIEVAEVILEKDIEDGVNNRIENMSSPVSPVAVAKMHDDESMIDLLFSYGFEDVFVDPKHIEQASKSIDFKEGKPKEIIENLKKGKLPGLDFNLPASEKKIIEAWGNYKIDEAVQILEYNYHLFYQSSNWSAENSSLETERIYWYSYQFPSDHSPKIVTIKEVLGEPDGMMTDEEISELEYFFGGYYLVFIVNSNGYVTNVNYYYDP